jgi:3-oxoacyl-[acyl-carrier protein] reductase
MRGLKDKVVLITGAAGGIGKATALRFAEEGSKVIVADYADGQKTVQEISSMGGSAVYVNVDVRDGNSAVKMVEEGIRAFGCIDVLINNAGITKDSMMKKMDRETWDDCN